MGRVDAIIGGQWGSEGKGKIASALSRYYEAAVRTGAPNAGHTVRIGGNSYVMRSIPCAWTNPDCQLFVGPGGLINAEVIAEELARLPHGILARLMFDRNAVIVTHADIEDEEKNNMNAKVGSTAEGVGVAQARKVLRRDCRTLSQMQNDLPSFMSGRIGDVAAHLNHIYDQGGAIMLEGTQGFGLSLNHNEYPFVTSRDILSASLFSDAGLAPATHRYTWMVMRTYPIRVAGNSGPMGNAKELTWAEISERCGAPDGAIVEKTTVTKRVRRVSEIDWDFMKRSVALNRPTGIFLTFADYIDYSAHGCKSYSELPGKIWDFAEQVERTLGVPVVGLSTGPDESEMIYTPRLGDIAPEFAQLTLSLV